MNADYSKLPAASMSIRDVAAIAAMQGLCSENGAHISIQSEEFRKLHAEWAVKQADALISALNSSDNGKTE